MPDTRLDRDGQWWWTPCYDTRTGAEVSGVFSLGPATGSAAWWDAVVAAGAGPAAQARLEAGPVLAAPQWPTPAFLLVHPRVAPSPRLYDPAWVDRLGYWIPRAWDQLDPAVATVLVRQSGFPGGAGRAEPVAVHRDGTVVTWPAPRDGTRARWWVLPRWVLLRIAAQPSRAWVLPWLAERAARADATLIATWPWPTADDDAALQDLARAGVPWIVHPAGRVRLPDRFPAGGMSADDRPF
jgi:hypothetical protein